MVILCIKMIFHTYFVVVCLKFFSAERFPFVYEKVQVLKMRVQLCYSAGGVWCLGVLQEGPALGLCSLRL